MKTYTLNNNEKKYIIKISDKFADKCIRIAFTKAQADKCINELLNAKRDAANKAAPQVYDEWAAFEVDEESLPTTPSVMVENTFEAINVYDGDIFVCYCIIDRDEMNEYVNNRTIKTSVKGNVITIGYLHTIRREEAKEIAAAYENFINLASEYDCINKKEKELLTEQYNGLAEKDKNVIDFNPNSIWFRKNNINARHNLIVKCANQFLIDELNGVKTLIHDVFTRGYLKDEYKDITKTSTRTGLYYSYKDLKTGEIKKNVAASEMRVVVIMSPNIVYEPMKYERTKNYRNSLKDHNVYDLKGYSMGKRCSYCGYVYDDKFIEADHIIPVYAVKNGHGKYWKGFMKRHHYEQGINDPKNITPACIYCNRRKGKKQGLWILCGWIGRHKTVWHTRKMAMIGITLYFFIKTFKNVFYGPMDSLIDSSSLMKLVLIASVWIGHYSLHQSLTKKAYEKREKEFWNKKKVTP